MGPHHERGKHRFHCLIAIALLFLTSPILVQSQEAAQKRVLVLYNVVRFPDPHYRSALYDFLSRKYEHQSFDLVITVAAAALDFVGSTARNSSPALL
jgi:hypothetical protein